MTTITTQPDGLGGVWVYAGTVRLGRVFPAATTGLPDHQPRPGCRWFARRDHTHAQPFDSYAEAYAYITTAQEHP